VPLRTRLLVGLLVLAAAGLAIAGAITYREQKQFLYDRLDGQVSAAARDPGLADPTFQQGTSEPIVPLGTYVQVRDADNHVIAHSEEYSGIAAPNLPTSIEIEHYYTVGEPPFRVFAENGFYRGIPVVFVAAIPLHDVNDSLHQLLLVELFVALGVLAALALLTYFVVMLGLRPLRQMEETAGAIAAGDLSQRVEVVDEHTEVGRLGIALNEMLHQIETAFDERTRSEERLRRFVADASHELRTPLTSIRGYAELFRRGAADRPEDLAKTMRRIEEEAARMGILVDDLLLLARLDQGRPLEREPVDLTRITADAVDDARAIAPDRPYDYTPDGAVVVPGDEPRLRQVLANLLQNANRHTPPATPVHVRVTTDGPDAVIEVRDEGPGLDPETASRVFERFWRSDPSRARQSGGAGLGLAIVAAIASAHGGRAEVQTAPGQGATFRVVLPRTKPATPPPDEVATPMSPSVAPPVPNIPLADLEELEESDA
jgi:two-component system OmpR family sensor kinase